MKKIGHWIILVILIYSVIEFFSWGGLYYLKRFKNINYEAVGVISDKHKNITNTFLSQQTNYVIFSTTLGWTIKENGISELYQANSSGIRSTKEYMQKPSDGIFRISTFGDSFTHCDDVTNNETWQSIIENTDVNIEVINFGVGGFGLDQAYLRYLEDGRQYNSHIVLIGFMSENIYRNVNVFRPFYFPDTGIPLAKPRFRVEGEKFSLLSNPMHHLDDYKILLSHPQETLFRMGMNDYYYQNRYKSGGYDWSPTVRLIKILRYTVKNELSSNSIMINDSYNEKSEAFRVTIKIFDEFYHEVKKNKSIPIILIFPNEHDVSLYQKQKKKRYSPLLSYLDSQGYRYIDLVEIFEQAEIESLFSAKGHYSPFANRLVAKHILNYISQEKGAKLDLFR